jgi:hypothetical protein
MGPCLARPPIRVDHVNLDRAAQTKIECCVDKLSSSSEERAQTPLAVSGTVLHYHFHKTIKEDGSDPEGDPKNLSPDRTSRR